MMVAAPEGDSDAEEADQELIDEDDAEEEDDDGVVLNGGNPLSGGVNNTAMLRQTLEEIRHKAPWSERLDVTAGVAVAVADPNDDLRRELQLYVLVFPSSIWCNYCLYYHHRIVARIVLRISAYFSPLSSLYDVSCALTFLVN